MSNVTVTVVDGNNVNLEVVPQPNVEVTIDRGIVGPPGPPGPGDVNGPASSTDNAVARFDGTTGELIQNSTVLIDDSGNITQPLSVTMADGAGTTVVAGRMWYDGTTGSWNLGMGGGNITQQVGEELFVYGKASAAITDSPLQLIYQTGAVGASGVITFAPTVAGITDGNLLIGVATEPISNNAFGRITSYGVVHGITTNGTAYGETWADGDVIWYNPVTGNPTNVKPTAPHIKVQIGIITHAGNGGSGSIFVLLNPGSVLGGTDSNVQITSAANGDLLTYDATAGYWENSSTLPGSYTLSGGTANGVAYLNGSKVLTTGSALTFDGTNFAVGGSASSFSGYGTASVNGATGGIFDAKVNGVRVGSFFAEAGSATLATATNVPLIFNIFNSEQMRLTSTGLGIGTSSPSTKLQVYDAGNSFSAVFGAVGGSQVVAIGNSGKGASVQGFSNSSFAAYADLVLQPDGKNLGLGVTPSAWTSIDKAFEIGRAGNGIFSGGIGDVTINSNAYYSSGWKYGSTGTANRFNIGAGSGQFQWFTAPSGTAGDAISFTQAMTLDASGNLLVGTTSSTYTASGRGVIEVGGGSTAIMALKVGGSGVGYTYHDGTAMSLWNVANGNLLFGTNNTEQMRLTSTGLGIGTSSPGYKLDVVGPVNLQGTSTFPTTGLMLRSGDNQLKVIGGSAGIAFAAASGASTFATLSADGNLGLGVNPSAWDTSVFRTLQVGSGAGSASLSGRTDGANNAAFGVNFYYGSGSLRYIANSTATYYNQQNGAHQWYTAPSGTAGNAISFTQAMTLDASGRLSLGTTVATSGFSSISLSGGPTGANTGIQLNYNSGAFGGGAITTVNAAGGGLSFYTYTGNVGSESYSERARITSDGNLLVGKTSYGSVVGTGCQLGAAGAAIFTANNDAPLYLSRVSTDGRIADFYRDTTQVGSISVTTSATAYNTSSDYRLKNITGPITTSGAYIDSLNPVEGTWKADGSTFVGLIAHEVQEASRTNVATGVKDGEQMQGMDYSNAELIANLIAEVKALRARVAALESN